MNIIKNKTFQGERPLFKTFNMQIEKCKFLPGESAVKESQNLKVVNSDFNSKYPFWHNNNIEITDSYFSEGARAAIWYTSNVVMKDCKVDAPKIFRDARNITIINTSMDTGETLWDCSNVKIENSHFRGDYLALHGSDIELENFILDGNYSFQHVKNAVVRNCILNSKDAFWNTENVTVYDSVLNGEYLAWYSKNLKLVNCKITGTQPLCYAENLVMENCEMIDTDLCFEYSTLDVEIVNVVESIKNPISGKIRAKGIETLILDDESLDFTKTDIVTKTPFIKVTKEAAALGV